MLVKKVYAEMSLPSLSAPFLAILFYFCVISLLFALNARATITSYLTVPVRDKVTLLIFAWIKPDCMHS